MTDTVDAQNRPAWLALAVFFLLVAAAAFFGATFRPGAWYAALQKPSWTPPNSVFSPVWTILYIMIALAGWLVWRAGGDNRPALIFWGIALALNALWSWFFFGQQRIGMALIDISALLVAIVGFILTARRVSPAATALFVPYLGWVSYATALNFAIWRLNP